MKHIYKFKFNKFMRKRILALAISLLMVLSLFGNISFNTFAEGDTTGSASIEKFLNYVTVFTDYDYDTATGTAFDPNKSYPENEVFTFRLEFMESYDTDNQSQFDGYTTFTYVLPDGISIETVQSDDIYFAEYSSDPVGNFVVNKDGTITVTLLTDYIEDYKNAQCWLTFDATLALSGDETEKTITFPDGTEEGKTITIKVDSEPGLSTTKSATYDATTKTATYIATATVKNGDMSNVTVKDVMGQDLTYTSDVSYVITDAQGNQTGTGTISANGTTGGFSSNSIGTVTEGSTITFTYSAQVDENAYKNNQVDATDNNITVTGDYVFDNETKTATSTAYYDIDNIVDFDYSWISKNGSLDEANSEVDWTVTINASREYALNGVTFTDVLGDFLELPNDFVINVTKTDATGNSTNETITSANYTETSDGFTYLFNDTQPFTYVFTYSTPYDVSSEFGGVNLTNTSTIASDDIGTHTDDAVVPINATTGIQKQVVNVVSPNADGTDLGNITWRTVITVPAEGLTDVSIIDTLPGVYDGTLGYSVYCELDESSIIVDNSTGVQTTYTISDTLDDWNHVNGFKLELGDLPGNTTPYTVTITYKTNTVKGFDYVNNKWVTNAVKLYVDDIEKSNASATAELVPPVDMVKSGEVASDGTITYTLQLDPGQVGFDGERVTIDDEFDTSKLEYVNGSATLYGSTSKWFNYQELSISVTGNTTSTGIEFDLGMLDDNEYLDTNTNTIKPYVYYLTYQLKIKEDTLAKTQGDITVDNVAKLYKDGDLAVTSSNTETYNNVLMDKNLDSYPSSSDSRFMFSVVMNEGRLDLVDGSDDITIVDVMSSNLTLDVSSVTVYEYKEITEGWTRYEYVALDSSEYTVAYDNVNKKISVKVPGGDGKHLKLSYGARVSGLIGAVETITNEVYIEGTAISDNIGSIDYTITSESSGNLNQSAGASGSISYLEINKYDSLIASKVLANAQFDLYAVNMVYDADGDKYTFTLLPVVLGTYTSDENGIARVEYADFLNNGVYLLRETKAPFGYELGDTTIVNSTATAVYNGIYESDFVFIFQNSTEQTSQEKLEILTGSGLPVVNSGGTILIPNEKKPLSVTATKNLVGRDMVAGEFKFKLTQCDATGKIIDGGQVAYGTNEAATAVNGVATSTITFEDITYDDLEFPTADTVHQFYYILSEETLSDTDIIYDYTTSQIIDVKVSIDGSGDMQISVNNANISGDYESGVEFTNIYKGSLYATYDITATKTVNNKTPTASQIFEFNIVQVDKDGNVKADGYSETVTNSGEVIDFATLSFTEVGDYYYRITESDAGVKGYTYDTSEYIVHINTATNDQGVLVATADITKNGAAATDVSFNNVYRELTSITVEKVWLDGNNADGTRPESIEVELLANGSQIDTKGTYVVELNATNNYSYTWDNIPVETENGITIPYSVVEKSTPTGYISTVTGNSTDGFVITNTRTTSVKVTKTWVDGNRDHSFDIINVRLYADGIETKSHLINASAGWTYEFTNLPMYNSDGSEIVYTVSEEIDGENKNRYIATVNGYDITNTLASTTIDLSAGKELIGEELTADNEFSFTVTCVEENGSAINYGYSETVNNTNNKDISDTTPDTTDIKWSGDVNFSPITYYDAGTYKYEIKEVVGTDTSYVYDTTTYTAEVTVARKADNSLVATVKYYNGSSEVTKPVFTNTKVNNTATTVDIIFSGTKKVTGAAVTNGFTFELYAGDLTSTPVQSKNNDGGSFTFNKISVTAAADAKYTYYVVEKADTTGKPGYTFDGSVYKIDVTFAADATGVLTPVYTYTKYASKDDAMAGTGGTSVTAIEFINAYNATGSLEIPVTKKYYADNDSQDFKFVLEDESGDTLNAETSEITITANSADSANGNEGKFTLNYDENDIGKYYTYNLVETAGTDSTITYDDTEYNLVVYVEDNGDGTLKLNTTIYKGEVADNVVVSLDNGIIFENTKTEDGEITIKATKELVAKELEADQFEFTLSQTDSGSNYTDSKKNDASGNVVFKPISYDLDDVGNVYTYEIKETSTGGNGYTVDDTVYTVEVEVTASATDGGGYTVIPVATYYKTVNGITTKLNQGDEMVFTNTYTASGNLTLSVNKNLSGGTLLAGDFEFILTENGTTIDTAKNDVNGKVTFDTITYNYKDIGTHTYVISEKKGSNGQILYSTAKYTVVAVVSDNNDGTLSVATTYYSGDISGVSISADDMEFTNTVIQNTTVPLEGKKKLQGATIAADQFEFQLKDSSGKVIETVKNDSTGTFSFSPLEFTASAAGNSYEFTVVEVSKDVPGYTYDENYYKVTIAVTESNGKLTATPTISKYSKGGIFLESGTNIEFINQYEATNSLTLTATKKVVGQEGAIPNGEYTFTLSDDTGVIQTVSNTGANIEFAPINYDMDDAGKFYTYTIREVDMQNPDMIYDDSVYNVEVKISDNGSGTLSVEKMIYKGDVSQGVVVSDIEFVNTAIGEGSFVAVAEKRLTGRKLTDGDFTFMLTDVTPNNSMSTSVPYMDTATNDGSGNIIFDEINYTMADVGKTYIYEISEVAGGSSAYTYDSTVYTVNVEVTYDSTTSKIVATPTITCEGNTVTDILFINEYQAKGSVTIEGEKYLNDKLTAEKFTFGIYADAACTNEIGTTTNDADGKFSFEFSYNEGNMEGASNKVYTYYVKEIAPSQIPMGYTYDDTVYPVNVVLIDLGNGTISAVASYPNSNDAVEIYNTYKDKNVIISKVDMSNSKELPGAELTITDKDGKEISKWTSTDKPHTIPATIFKTGEEYTLTEVTAPKGYAVAESIVFKVDGAGDVYVKNDKGVFEKLKDGMIVMEDRPQAIDTSTDTNINTGDTTPINMLFTLMVISAMGIASLLISKRKKEN